MSIRMILAATLSLAAALPVMPAAATNRYEPHHHARHRHVYRATPDDAQRRYGYGEGYAPHNGIGPYVNNTPSRSYGLEAAPGSYPAIGYGQDPRPNGGFAVNPYGYGNYTRGADGGFGGYPPGSAGAQELMESQNRKCRVVPEQC